MNNFTFKSRNPKSGVFRLLMVCLMSFFSQIPAYAQIQEDIFKTFKLVTNLPEALNEISGMVCCGDEGLLGINDGGNPAELIEFSSENGQILNRYPLNNATNTDWEALTLNRQTGMLYIADIGNNENKRKDLCIYVVHKDSIKNPETAVRKISFRYADQTSFPPPRDSMWYDAESALLLKPGHFPRTDSLWIITKNRTEPFDGKMYVYAVPLNEGDTVVAHLQNAKKYTDGSIKELEWITDATFAEYNPEYGVMFLSSSRTFRAYYEVIQGRPKSWWREENPFLFYTNLGMIQQFEAIIWAGVHRYLLACEASAFGPAALYAMEYPYIIMNTPEVEHANHLDLKYMSNGGVLVNHPGAFTLKLYSMNGQLLHEAEASESITLQADQLRNRPLLIQLTTKGRSMQRLLH